jgi:hypothetical protein
MGEGRWHPSTVERHPHTIGKSKHEVRTLAKHAILNLLPVKIGLDDFIREGVREDIVKGLFAELGQPPDRPPTDNKVTSMDQPAPQRTGIIPNVIDPLPVIGSHGTAGISSMQSTQPNHGSQTQAFSTATSAANITKPDAKILPSDMSASNPLQEMDTSKMLPDTKAQTPRSQPPPAVSVRPKEERKDLIARLLAAKSAKTTPTSSSGIGVHPQSNQEKPVTSVQTTTSEPKESKTQTERGNAFQNELIRQKMEALE